VINLRASGITNTPGTFIHKSLVEGLVISLFGMPIITQPQHLNGLSGQDFKEQMVSIISVLIGTIKFKGQMRIT